MKIAGFLSWCFIFYESSICQKWITPTNRVIYSLDGKPENLSWDVDYVGKKLFNARWTVYNDITRTEKVLVSVGTSPRYFQRNVTLIYTSVKDTHFTGKLSFSKLESSSFHKIGCIVTFNDFTELQDYVHIRYVAYKPNFLTPLPERQTYKEGDKANISIRLKGKPKPEILWKLKGKEIIANSFMRVTNEDMMTESNDTIITSTIQITLLSGIHNSVLEVLGKYGKEDIQSPTASTQMVLDVQYAPKNIIFTSNVTTTELQNDNYVRLLCVAEANPAPTYNFKKVIEKLYTGSQNSTTFYVTGIHEARFVSFTCTASNKFGMLKEHLDIDLDLPDDQLARYYSTVSKSKWWIYFIICAIILLLALFVMSVISFFTRRRSRSLTIIPIPNDNEKLKRRGKINHETESEKTRGMPDGTTKSQLQIDAEAYY